MVAACIQQYQKSILYGWKSYNQLILKENVERSNYHRDLEAVKYCGTHWGTKHLKIMVSCS